MHIHTYPANRTSAFSAEGSFGDTTTKTRPENLLELLVAALEAKSLPVNHEAKEIKEIKEIKGM